MKGLVLLERVVIESISKKNNFVMEIAKDLEIEASIVISVLARLAKKGLISYSASGYVITKNDLAWQNVNRDDSVKLELKELTENIVDTCFANKNSALYKLQKITITVKEEKILNSLMNNVETYIKNLREDRKKDRGYKDTTSKQKVIFWGHTNYREVVTNSITKVS